MSATFSAFKIIKPEGNYLPLLNREQCFDKNIKWLFLIWSIFSWKTEGCLVLFIWKRFQDEYVSRLQSFFHKQRFSSTRPQYCLTFSRIELQMLLRCCLIHISMTILRHFFYLLFLCPCQDLGLFMLYLLLLFHFHLHFHYD